MDFTQRFQMRSRFPGSPLSAVHLWCHPHHHLRPPCQQLLGSHWLHFPPNPEEVSMKHDCTFSAACSDRPKLHSLLVAHCKSPTFSFCNSSTLGRACFSEPGLSRTWCSMMPELDYITKGDLLCISIYIYMCVCVCVCTPWSHRVPFGVFRFGFHFQAAGGQDSQRRPRAREVKTYLLLLNYWLVAVVPWFVSWWFMCLMLFQEVFRFSGTS